jgi:hypothetical protein
MLGLGVTSAYAADSYNIQNHQLTSPTLTICNATYSDIVLTIGGITDGPTGTSANGTGDTFNPAYNRLSVPAVSVGGRNYFNVVASVAGLVSVGSVSGADSYDGKSLTISQVQVGATTYLGTVIRVGSIVSVGGGLPQGVRDLYNVESGRLFIPAVQDTVNGKVYTNVTVTVASILAIGSGGNPPTCGGLPTGTMLTAAQVNATGASVVTYYQSLPHSSAAGDLVSVAGYMVQSGLFVGAKVTPGGISATLPDGMDFIEFADRIEDQCADPEVSASGGASGRGLVLVCKATGGGTSLGGGSSSGGQGPAVGPSNSHEIAFLVNYNDGAAFTPDNQQLMASGLTNAGFKAPNHGVDSVEVTLDNILALGAGHPLDFLDIATHGLVYTASSPAGLLQYNWLSDTAITDANNAKFAADLSAGRLHYAGFLFEPAVATSQHFDRKSIVWYAFSPEFLQTHLVFNPGAIVDNQSCFGQHPLIATFVQKTLSAAGAGEYLGWDEAVEGDDADQTDAYLFDRLLGEANTSGLSKLVAQRTPLQRPFPLQDVLSAMGSETRSPVTESAMPANTYLEGVPISPNTNPTVNFVPVDLTGSASTDLIEYQLPSISTMYVQEAATGGTLVVLGNFPMAVGTGQIADASGTYPLTPSAWSTTSVQFSLPPGGNGASGLVTVRSSDGIPSNPVPLTQWSGTLTWQETDTFSIAAGSSGNGTGSMGVSLSTLFRADVHPVVQTIDTAPVPQNFFFTGLMGASQATLTVYNAVESDGNGNSATFTITVPPSTMFGGDPLTQTQHIGPGEFLIQGNPTAGLPEACNNGLPGPQAAPNTTFCPFIIIDAQDPASCTGTLCPSGLYQLASFGDNVAPYGSLGKLMLTMDPITYAVTVTSTPALSAKEPRFGQLATQNMSVTGVINAPTSAPTAATPAVMASPSLAVPALVR